MEIFSLRLKRATGPQQIHSAVIASIEGVIAVAVLARTAWPYHQLRTPTNATMKAYLWANTGFALLALAVFQFSLLVR